MSIDYCHGCDQYKDTDEDPLYEVDGKLRCENCADELQEPTN